jgi:hypothetical protein
MSGAPFAHAAMGVKGDVISDINHADGGMRAFAGHS